MFQLRLRLRDGGDCVDGMTLGDMLASRCPPLLHHRKLLFHQLDFRGASRNYWFAEMMVCQMQM